MFKQTTRLVIGAKDIILITGKSEKYARNILSEIRTHFRKEPKDLVTVFEFCEYTRLPLAHILPYLRN